MQQRDLSRLQVVSSDPSGRIHVTVEGFTLTSIQIARSELVQDNASRLSEALRRCINQALDEYVAAALTQLRDDHREQERQWSVIDEFLARRTAPRPGPLLGEITHGSALDGDVELSLQGGRLASLKLYPTLMVPDKRYALEGAVIDAVNDALRQSVTAEPEPHDPPTVDDINHLVDRILDLKKGVLHRVR